MHRHTFHAAIAVDCPRDHFRPHQHSQLRILTSGFKWKWVAIDEAPGKLQVSISPGRKVGFVVGMTSTLSATRNKIRGTLLLGDIPLKAGQ